MSEYLKEAFKELDTLKEDVFDFSVKGIEDLKNFMDGDYIEEQEVVIDPEAIDEEELKDSYEGKVILCCDTCQSKIYKDKEEVTIDEELDCANVGEECPYCGSTTGFAIIGEVAPFEEDSEKDEEAETEEEPEEEFEEMDDYEEIEDKPLKESNTNLPSSLEISFEDLDLTEEEFKDDDVVSQTVSDYLSDHYGFTHFGFDYQQEYLEDGTPKSVVIKNIEWDLGESVEDLHKIDKELNKLDEDVVKKDGKWMNKGKEGTHGKFATKKQADAQRKAMFANGYKTESLSDLEKIDKALNKLEEDFQKVEIETDKEKMSMTSEENGKVVVTTEPKESYEEDKPEEVIKPVSDETKEEIKANSEEVPEETPEEIEDVEVDEFDEETFDELGESYLKEVYDNVDSYSTKSAKLNGDKIILEGLLKFTSGKEVKTSFIFESHTKLKNGKLKFLGENTQITKNQKAFTLTGRCDNKKLFLESLTYNYTGKDAKTNKSKKLYGTVKKSK